MRVYIDIHTCILHTLIYMCTYIHIHMYNERLRGALDGDISESHNDVAHVISSVHALASCPTQRAVDAAAEDQALPQAQASSAAYCT